MSIVWPGSGRLTLALLAIVPAAMAYPWQTVTQRWVLGIAAAWVIILFVWWRGLHLTTMIGRRLALLGSRGGGGGAHQLIAHTGADARTTALIRVLPESEGDLPLSVIASYLDRYGLRAEAVRITSRDNASGRTTWIGLTMSAAANLPALQARSAQIPLRDTAEVAVRRLADHLRELGWLVTATEVDVPDLLGPEAKEKWRAVQDGSKGYVAAYAVQANSLTETLTELAAYSSPEVWTAVQITSGGRVSAACAIRTEELPGSAAPVPGLVSLRGRQLASVHALSPDTTELLAAPAGIAGVLDTLHWPAGRETVRT